MTSYRDTRRRFVRNAVALACASACAPLIAQEGGVKTPKDKVAYQDSPKNGQRCSDCSLFVAESNTCQVVEGDISPEGWCKLFAPAQ